MDSVHFDSIVLESIFLLETNGTRDGLIHELIDGTNTYRLEHLVDVLAIVSEMSWDLKRLG